ncbi:MAG: hypothetical protein L6R30_00780 [Thermoanaerobaculia bacterium]|nr:hypothetical protein [Thermoanaerobaculia bacterium]MCK6680936.1 hypothetical protein [Thermoanaerobaculia bacterium]
MAQNETPNESARVVEEKINTARETMGDRMGRFKERMDTVSESVKAKASELRDKIKETDMDDVVTGVKDYVRDNPGKSVAIALGVGFALGLLLRRRGDD